LEKRQRDAIARIVNRWAWYLKGEMPKELKEALGIKHDLEPIKPELWPMMAMMFENTAEANRPPRSIVEATVKTDIALPAKWYLPIIRDVFAALIMNRICGVQPMPPESGGTMNVFYKHTYREDAPGNNVTVADSDYAEAEENAVPMRLEMEITKVTVEATKKMLMATWSTEVEEDARGALGIDVEQELVTDMSQEILRELEHVVIGEMWNSASLANVTWTAAYPAGATYSYTDHYQTLFHSLIDADAEVYNSVHRHADWIICGSTFAAYIDKAKFWSSTMSEQQSPSQMSSGVQYAGTIGNRWTVFTTPYLNASRALMSTWPTSAIDAGYIWAPYVPLMPMPKIYAEELPWDDATLPGALIGTDKWTTYVRTRNAKLCVQPARFVRILIA
jgi:hypothetical protein